MNLLYKRFSSGNLVVFAPRSIMVDFDCQIDKRGGQNLREKRDKMKRETSREMVVLLK